MDKRAVRERHVDMSAVRQRIYLLAGVGGAGAASAAVSAVLVRAVDPVVVDALVARRTRNRGSPLSALTGRELDVLREMAQGNTNTGIERSLHLSASTVEKHINSIFGKLGLAESPVHRRVAAVLTFLRDARSLDTT